MMSAPLSPGAPRLWTIPPGPGFLDALACELARAVNLAGNPSALADALIFLPNSRSVGALSQALFEAAGRSGLLMPDIRALGDLPGEAPSPLLAGLGLDLPPAPEPAERLGLLAALVQTWGRSEGKPFAPASALAMARELAGLLDQAAMSGLTDWRGLETLVTDPGLAAHWQKSAQFVEILREHWPAILAERGWSEAESLRREAAEALARAWQETPPRGPVIIAGSTGTHAASRILMRAALGLPNGLVVLPGLDTALDAGATAGISATPSHPQHALVRTLAELGHSPADAAVWPVAPGAAPRERARLLDAALAPAEATADWMSRLDALADGGSRDAFVRRALDGVTLIEASDETDEARIIACLMREALERPVGRTALVTPDATIGRRVSAELARWDIALAPSAGTPLMRTPAGSLAGLVAHWLSDPGHPADLLALLKHPLARFGLAAPTLAACVERFETAHLRGPRRWDTLEDIAARAGDLAGALGRLAALAVLPAGPVPLRRLCETIANCCEFISSEADQPACWNGPDGAGAARLLRELADFGTHAGPVPVGALAALVETFADGTALPEPGGRDERLAIWGPLEARLQSAGRVILAGLNEGTWPELPGASLFLPRHFRVGLGLPDPEARVGLSAHDFAQLACAREVFLVRARRVDNQPAVLSRWLWRLRTLTLGALGRNAAEDALSGEQARQARGWARQLDRAVEGLPAGEALRPMPRPPLEARPETISVTEVETLIRDPYTVYARRILRLRPLEPVAAPLSPANRGTALHLAVQHFQSLPEDERTPDALARALDEQLAEAGETLAQRRAGQAVRLEMAHQCVNWLGTRPDLARVLSECAGQLQLEIDGIQMTLKGRADRIEVRTDGRLAIIDFKTGAAPGAREVDIQLASQLPLLAAMAAQGSFAGLDAAETEELLYVLLKARFEVRRAGGTATTPMEKASSALEGLRRLLQSFRDPGHPYRSKPVAKFQKAWGDFDHLARRAEWADAGAGDAEDEG